MGSRTRDDIIMEGMNRGGRDNMLTVMAGNLNDWLDRMGRSWTWPKLTRRRGEIPLNAGTAQVLIGNGSSGVAERVTHLIGKPLIYDEATRRVRGRLTLVDYVDEYSNAQVAGGGSTVAPSFYTVETVSENQLRLMFSTLADQNYLMDMVLHLLPARLTSGTEIPWYPEDSTMIQAIMAATLRSENGVDSPSYQSAVAELDDMVANDRIKHGVTSTLNAVFGLNSEVYR